MGEMRKITVEVPAELLAHAQEETGRDVADTVREGLKRLASRRAQRELLKLRGAVKLDLNLDELREDRF